MLVVNKKDKKNNNSKFDNNQPAKKVWTYRLGEWLHCKKERKGHEESSSAIDAVYFMRTKSTREPAFGWSRIAGKSSVTDSRLESTVLGRRALRLPMKPPTKFRMESPEMAGVKPEVGFHGPLDGGVVTLTERSRKPASWLMAASRHGLLSKTSEAERLRKRAISSWILPALNTAPGIEAIMYVIVALSGPSLVELQIWGGKGMPDSREEM